LGPGTTTARPWNVGREGASRVRVLKNVANRVPPATTHGVFSPVRGRRAGAEFPSSANKSPAFVNFNDAGAKRRCDILYRLRYGYTPDKAIVYIWSEGSVFETQSVRYENSTINLWKTFRNDFR